MQRDKPAELKRVKSIIYKGSNLHIYNISQKASGKWQVANGKYVAEKDEKEGKKRKLEASSKKAENSEKLKSN